ncbi:hypothetical protein [Pseudarthrobacter sulfonivorans]|uniref:hypothetical protein n=1 Tax=Pseudarthrobacter sulfonivorans TaxID=121292 RepID=UPI0028669736|nr:hypothetical protein [Pseudarthrobacter sulfonivorans]MDR6413686.1 hypothetical protein [Pseudarthrobacter sulfonivorans]
MDFPLSSSVILVVAVVLWIVWVAPYVLRNRRHQFQAAAEYLADVPRIESSDPRAGTVMNITAQQEKAMDIRKSPTTAAAPSGSATTGAFRIRYGRTGIALAGVAALLTAFVSGVLLLFGLGTALLPLAGLAVTVSAVVLLRFLAVRERKAKVDRAFRSAMSAPVRHKEPRADATDSPRPVYKPESRLFDAEAHEPAPKPLTAMELREAALAVAVAAGDTSAATAVPMAKPADTTWEPVEVPKPVYVEAAKAERPAPQPLDLPEAPKAAGKPSLKQGTPAAIPAAQPAKPLTKAQSALSNLDDVLQRRRA